MQRSCLIQQGRRSIPVLVAPSWSYQDCNQDTGAGNHRTCPAYLLDLDGASHAIVQRHLFRTTRELCKPYAHHSGTLHCTSNAYAYWCRRSTCDAKLVALLSIDEKTPQLSLKLKTYRAFTALLTTSTLLDVSVGRQSHSVFDLDTMAVLEAPVLGLPTDNAL